jgi:hypothetical protein
VTYIGGIEFPRTDGRIPAAPRRDETRVEGSVSGLIPQAGELISLHLRIAAVPDSRSRRPHGLKIERGIPQFLNCLLRGVAQQQVVML